MLFMKSPTRTALRGHRATRSTWSRRISPTRTSSERSSRHLRPLTGQKRSTSCHGRTARSPKARKLSPKTNLYIPAFLPLCTLGRSARILRTQCGGWRCDIGGAPPFPRRSACRGGEAGGALGVHFVWIGERIRHQRLCS